jgi:hypothetical protein
MNKLIFPALLFLILIIGCRNKQSDIDSTTDKVGSKNLDLGIQSFISNEATGVFAGEEPAYSM